MRRALLGLAVRKNKTDSTVLALSWCLILCTFVKLTTASIVSKSFASNSSSPCIKCIDMYIRQQRYHVVHCRHWVTKSIEAAWRSIKPQNSKSTDTNTYGLIFKIPKLSANKIQTLRSRATLRYILHSRSYRHEARNTPVCLLRVCMPTNRFWKILYHGDSLLMYVVHEKTSTQS